MQTLHKQEFDAKAIAVTSPAQNSRDLNPTDYHVWGALLQTFHKHHPKSKTIPELKKVHSSRSGMTCHGQWMINRALKGDMQW